MVRPVLIVNEKCGIFGLGEQIFFSSETADVLAWERSRIFRSHAYGYFSMIMFPASMGRAVRGYSTCRGVLHCVRDVQHSTAWSVRGNHSIIDNSKLWSTLLAKNRTKRGWNFVSSTPVFLYFWSASYVPGLPGWSCKILFHHLFLVLFLFYHDSLHRGTVRRASGGGSATSFPWPGREEPS